MKKAPIGVKLIAVFAIFEGLLMIAAGAFIDLFNWMSGFSVLGALGAIVFLLLGGLSLGYGLGLLYLENWAWWWGMIVTIIDLIGKIPTLADLKWPSLVVLLLDIVILLYLWQPKIRRLFRVSL